MVGDVSLYKKLIGEVLKVNRDVIDVSQIYFGVHKFVDEFPSLHSFELDDDFNISIDEEDAEDAIKGLRSVLITIYDYITLVAGPQEAEKAVVHSVHIVRDS